MSASLLSALSTLAAAVGAGAVLGVIFVPTPNQTSISGALPGEMGKTFAFNQDDGVLRILDATGAVLAAGTRDAAGVFHDAETGVPFGRLLNGALMFDTAATATEEKNEDVGTIPWIDVGDDVRRRQAQLCPDPGPDVPNWASARAIAYQAQISALNNPMRPLPPGLAVSLPLGPGQVVFDDCRESDGTMIEAKGPGYERLFRRSAIQDAILRRWARQAERQSLAAGERNVEWYFAESSVAEDARAYFAEHSSGLARIKTFHVPVVLK